MNLLRTIITSRWAISPEVLPKLHPLVESALRGNINFTEFVKKEPVCYGTIKGNSVVISEDRSAMQQQQDSVVAIVPIKGIITKYDFCWEMGLMSLERLLLELDADPEVSAIVMDFDTPGGEAGYLPNIAGTLRNIETPMIAFYSGMCCSAGYYLAAHCQEIYASVGTDIVGSIGTMIQLQRSNDVEDHVINATAAPDKNRMFLEALDGKYELIRTKLLDPFNDQFHADMQLARPQIKKEALTGATYDTTNAIEMKLVDGRKTLLEVVSHAFGLGKSKSKSKTPNNMKYAQMSAILGREVTDPSQLSAEDWALVDAALAATPAADPTAAAPTPQLSAAEISTLVQQTVAAAMTTALQPFSAQLDTISTRLDTVEGEPGAEGTKPPKVDGEDQVKPAWSDPNNKLNQAAAAAIGG